MITLQLYVMPYAQHWEYEDLMLLFGEDQLLIIDKGAHNFESHGSSMVRYVLWAFVVRKPSYCF